MWNASVSYHLISQSHPCKRLSVCLLFLTLINSIYATLYAVLHRSPLFDPLSILLPSRPFSFVSNNIRAISLRGVFTFCTILVVSLHVSEIAVWTPSVNAFLFWFTGNLFHTMFFSFSDTLHPDIFFCVISVVLNLYLIFCINTWRDSQTLILCESRLFYSNELNITIAFPIIILTGTLILFTFNSFIKISYSFHCINLR